MVYVREQDRFLPIANIARIMKRSLPENAKVAKDAKECVQECVSEFVSFITSEASEKCAQEKRKTINGEDILFAMQNLGFDNYYEPLKVFLNNYRDQTDKTHMGKAGARPSKEDEAHLPLEQPVQQRPDLMVYHQYPMQPQGVRMAGYGGHEDVYYGHSGAM